MEKMRDIVIKSLENVGVIVDDASDNDINLCDYDIDSVTFISFIVDLEEELSIEIPDQYLKFDILSSLNGFSNLLTNIVEI